MAAKPPATSAFRLLLRYVRPHRRILAFGTVISSVGGAAALATPLLAREFVDRLGSGRPILGLTVLLCGVVLAAAVVAGVGRYLIDRTAEEIVRDVRSGLVTRLLRLRVGAFNTTPPGDLISRVTADTTLLRHATTNDLVDLMLGTVVLLGMVGFMVYLDPVLFGVVAAVMLVVGGATAWSCRAWGRRTGGHRTPSATSAAIWNALSARCAPSRPTVRSSARPG